MANQLASHEGVVVAYGVCSGPKLSKDQDKKVFLDLIYLIDDITCN